MRREKIESDMVFYKFKALDNFEHLFDMLVRERMYAATLSELNDPMEGIIKADPTVPRSMFDEWESAINDVRIASFTTEKDNELLWAHYADGGRGCRIGFQIPEDVEFSLVKYKNAPTWDGGPIDSGKLQRLLSYKLSPWRYERECRVVLKNNMYIPIKVTSIEFGPLVPEEKRKMLEHMIELLKPNVSLSHKRFWGKVNPIHTTGRPVKVVIRYPKGCERCEDCESRADKINRMSESS
ncbi:DUF2971 domain-containing protein [Rheinheimera soli]|uniref:DUF2971 domain-containing protein n=1 Tax=Rheinheimera soli TaxID=443616 RepID=UPI001E30D8C0|nr:DUF2971 domain-containing protein [Rheinheimera soli]